MRSGRGNTTRRQRARAAARLRGVGLDHVVEGVHVLDVVVARDVRLQEGVELAHARLPPRHRAVVRVDRLGELKLEHAVCAAPTVRRR